MTKQEQIEEILIDFGSKFYQKEPNGKIHFKNYDVKSAVEKIVNIFSLNPPVIGSADSNKNPYTLKWYDSKMTQTEIAVNNKKYWEWEIKYNGFKCP